MLSTQHGVSIYCVNTRHTWGTLRKGTHWAGVGGASPARRSLSRWDAQGQLWATGQSGLWHPASGLPHPPTVDMPTRLALVKISNVALVTPGPVWSSDPLFVPSPCKPRWPRALQLCALLQFLPTPLPFLLRRSPGSFRKVL